MTAAPCRITDDQCAISYYWDLDPTGTLVNPPWSTTGTLLSALCRIIAHLCYWRVSCRVAAQAYQRGLIRM